MSLVEIGPRFVLTPIRIFEGAFGGATVFANPGTIISLAGPAAGADIIALLYLKHFVFATKQNLYRRRLLGPRDGRRRAKSTRIASLRNESWVSGGLSESERRIHLPWPRSLPKMHRCLLASGPCATWVWFMVPGPRSCSAPLPTVVPVTDTNSYTLFFFFARMM